MSTLTDMWNELRARYEGRHEPENIRPLADLFWRVVIAAAIFMALCVLAYGTWIFVSVISQLGSADGVAASKPPVALDRKQLEATLQALDQRAADSAALKASPNSTADPSL